MFSVLQEKAWSSRQSTDCFCLQAASFPPLQCAMCKVHTILDTTWLQASWPHFCAYPWQESNSFSGGSQKDIFCWSPWIRTTKLSIIWNLWAINSYTWHWLEPDLHVFHGCWKNAFSIFKIVFFKGFSLYCFTEKQFYFTDFTCEKFKRAILSSVVFWVTSTNISGLSVNIPI